MQLFEGNLGATSAVDLVEGLHNQMNKTTVYRILERLENDGLIHSFIGNDGLRWYAKCEGCSSERHIDAHPHFQCLQCGKVDCLELDLALPEVGDYKIQSAALFLTGYCSGCISQRSNEQM